MPVILVIMGEGRRVEGLGLRARAMELRHSELQAANSAQWLIAALVASCRLK